MVRPILLQCLLTIVVFLCIIVSILYEVLEDMDLPRLQQQDVIFYILFLTIPVAYFVGIEKDFDVASKSYRTMARYTWLSWLLYLTGIWFYMVYKNSNPDLRSGLPSASAVLCYASHTFMASSKLSLISMSQNFGLKKEYEGSSMHLFLNNFQNILLAIGALFLAVLSEFYSGHSRGYLKFTLILCSIFLSVIAIFNTYGLGGLLVNYEDWNFWKPYKNGRFFGLIQGLSWFVFSLSLILKLLFILSNFIIEFELFVGVMVVAGALCLLSVILMVLSLLMFKSKNTDSIQDHISSWVTSFYELMIVTLLANSPYAVNLVFLAAFYLTPGLSTYHVIVCSILFSLSISLFVFVLSSSKQAYYRDSQLNREGVNGSSMKYYAPVILGGSAPILLMIHFRDTRGLPTFILLNSIWYIYVLSTFRGRPEMYGTRMDKKWITSNNPIAEASSSYFSSRLIRTGILDPKSPYLLCFHPHGILPITVTWLQLTKKWRELFPGIYGCPLTASAVHQIPLVRDILQKLGAREVTHGAFSYALKNKQSVILVPGGQAEMIESRSHRKEVRIYRGHKGFIRLALKYGTSVVPILSYFEGEVMDNVDAPRLQRWFIQKFAIPFPFFPYGRCGLPIPRKVPLTVVVGTPLKLPKIKNPSETQVDKYHREYYEAVEKLFHDHKNVAGCEGYKLIFINKK